MAFRDLREALEAFRAAGRLLEVARPVSPRYELAAVIAAAARTREAALLFTAVRGHTAPVAANVMYAREALAQAMGVAPPELVERFRERLQTPLAPRSVTTAPVNAQVAEPVDLGQWPVLTHYEHDSGPYITTGMAAVRDPTTGRIERTICRMELRGKDELGMAFVNPPTSEIYRRWGRERALPVAVVVGLEPVTFLAGALPASPGVDKLAAAGGLRGEPVEVFTAPLTGLDVPARAELLLEGELDPAGERTDGPFGEVSGYGLTFADIPAFRVRRLSHREQPLYHALLPTGAEADALLGLVVEAAIGPQVRGLFPFLQDITFAPGTFGASLVVRVRPTERTRVRGLLHHLLSLDRVKKVVVVADDVDPSDPLEVEWSVVTRSQPDVDLVVVEDVPGHPIDPSCHKGLRTARLGIDATGFERVAGRRKVGFPQEARDVAREVVERLVAGPVLPAGHDAG
ncbi:MAG: UbiD family decarboxylase [Actinobacteria bacterium]|nr:UbiD family decarboxylase [Actinomycetota bacterium]